MSHEGIGPLIPIIISLGAFMMVWGIRYFENKENMALIERGMEPKKRRRADPTRTLRNGMTFVGAGLGLLLAILVINMFGMHNGEGAGITISLMAVFGGLGMLSAYFYERRNPPTLED